MIDDVCLDLASVRAQVKMLRCHGLGGNQKWEYDPQVGDEGIRSGRQIHRYQEWR